MRARASGDRSILHVIFISATVISYRRPVHKLLEKTSIHEPHIMELHFFVGKGSFERELYSQDVYLFKLIDYNEFTCPTFAHRPLNRSS